MIWEVIKMGDQALNKNGAEGHPGVEDGQADALTAGAYTQIDAPAAGAYTQIDAPAAGVDTQMDTPAAGADTQMDRPAAGADKETDVPAVESERKADAQAADSDTQTDTLTAGTDEYQDATRFYRKPVTVRSPEISSDSPDYQGTGHVRIRTLEMKEISQEDIDRVLELTGQLEDFDILMMYYDCALTQMRTKLEILNREVALKKKRNPFESIKSRLKKPVSIYEKLKLRRIPFSVENIEKYLTDVAGLRVVCSFIDDIYIIRDSLASQDDVKIIQEKDYIAHPKKNGYRSLHLIIEVPIFLMQEKKYMRVELQFRTIAMDFWASVEHNMKYKKEIKNAESIVEELRYSADLINQLDRRMLQIRERIERSEVPDSAGKK